MTKVQAGIAVVAVALLVGAGGLYYHYSPPKQAADSVPQTVSAPRIVPGSPRSVVYDLFRGIQEGKGELIRRALYVRDAHEEEAVGALVEYSVAASRLTDLGDATFGPGKLHPLGLPLSRPGLEAQVAQLNEVVDDDLAEVDLYPSSSPSVFHLRKIEGRWWVMVRQTFEPGRLDETGPLAEMVQTLGLQAEVYTQVSRDIESGKLTAPWEAQATLSRRLSQAYRRAWDSAAQTSNPATAPSADLP